MLSSEYSTVGLPSASPKETKMPVICWVLAGKRTLPNLTSMEPLAGTSSLFGNLMSTYSLLMVVIVGVPKKIGPPYESLPNPVASDGFFSMSIIGLAVLTP